MGLRGLVEMLSFKVVATGFGFGVGVDLFGDSFIITIMDLVEEALRRLLLLELVVVVLVLGVLFCDDIILLFSTVLNSGLHFCYLAKTKAPETNKK